MFNNKLYSNTDSIMDNRMLTNLKKQNPTKPYPVNVGQLWTTEEETTLLEELGKNINIETIAETHSRTVGGITSRQRVIAYNMYKNKISIEEISLKTKLDKEQIMKTIAKRENIPTQKINQEELETVSLKNEIMKMRSEIKEFKIAIKELVDMVRAVYEFEHVN